MERPPLPEKLVRTAREYEAGDREPATPRNAATVVLLRPGPTGPEAYLLQRRTSMAFAAGMSVFPGGGVDPRDAEPAPDWAGPAPEVWASRLGTSPELARELVAAAVRETFEESGVLLAGTGPDDVVADTTGEDWEADRQALVNHEVSLTEVLVRRGLVLRSDLLGAWSGWLTPVFEPKRYRTWFFVASLPHGQRTRDVSTESVAVSWRSVAEVVPAVRAGELQMMPPTYLTCLEIAQHDDPDAVLAAANAAPVEMFMPELTRAGEEWTLSMPVRITALLAAQP